MTQIIKDKYKDARFRKGHVVTEADIPLLLSMGKEHLYPLVNSLRIAAISAVVVFFAGIAAMWLTSPATGPNSGCWEWRLLPTIATSTTIRS